jgi:Fe2+ transport protein
MRATVMALCLAALATAAAGCGDDDDAAGAGTGTTTAPVNSEVPEGVAEQYATIEEEVEAEGGDTESGPWRIAYIVEPAEGWFERRGGELRFRGPAAGETHHIEILPIEAESGRLVPDVPVTLEVLDASGRRVAHKRLSSYYAEFFHYADNFSIPRAGEYTLRATIEPPPFRRHGEEQEEPPLAEGATVEFDGVVLEPEQ